jgi:hypothetical protein
MDGGGAVMSVYTVRPLEPVLTAPTTGRRDSPFKATWTDTLGLLGREIAMLQTGAQRSQPWVLQMDVPESQIRRDGGVYVNATPRSPAVRVAFESRHGPLIYGTDAFWKWQANVRAIALSLEALRKVNRYGVAGAGEQYRGWVAISNRPAVMTREQAAEFIAYQAGAEHGEARAWADKIMAGGDELTRAFRLAARNAHPDFLHDDGDTMARLNVARDLLLRGAP